jgi:protein-arginine deiminase
MSFVPAPDRKMFRLVLASPSLAYEILENAAASGHSKTRFLKGKRYDRTVDNLLKDRRLREQNSIFQKSIDWNKAVLIREMGLQPADIVYLPALYHVEGGDGRAGAYFPGMVNMQVVNGHLAIPKPFGPVVNGQCVFEKSALNVFQPLGLTCHFVDTYEGYHIQMGEIHCGTNVVRRPFVAPWWNFDPATNSIEMVELPMRSKRRG